MERKIGEVFYNTGNWVQCVVQPDCKIACDLCYFKGKGNCELDECSGDYRSDKTSVIFKRLENVGEPFERNGYMYQEYKVHTFPLLMNGDAKIPTSNGFGVIIKQTKEDMEENKLNLKPFDLEKAKAGKPVCTRDGRKARIIRFDRKFFFKEVSYPILALVERPDGEDDVCAYNEKGKVLIEDDSEFKDDLMMLPEKKEGWVNVYKGLVCTSVYPRIYKSKEEAVGDNTTVNRIDTVKIEWEE